MFEASYGVFGKWQGVDQGGLAMLHNMALQMGGEAPAQHPEWPGSNTTFGMALQVNIGRMHSSHVLASVPSYLSSWQPCDRSNTKCSRQSFVEHR
jgi:hypothetical protein